jgi:single-stranded DNA-binding protein
MVSIEVIGNIGADAKKVNYNGTQFVTFNICDNRKVNDQEVSQWYGCNINRVNENLLKYLVKGQQVFVRGVPRYRVFDSAVHRCKCVAIDIFVNDIQLVGAAPASNNQEESNQPTEENVEVF